MTMSDNIGFDHAVAKSATLMGVRAVLLLQLMMVLPASINDTKVVEGGLSLLRVAVRARGRGTGAVMKAGRCVERCAFVAGRAELISRAVSEVWFDSDRPCSLAGSG